MMTLGAAKAIPKPPLVVAWFLGFTGAYLVWSALTDRSPIEDLRTTLTGGRAEASRPLPGRSSSVVGGGASGASSVAGIDSTAGGNPVTPPSGGSGGSRPPTIARESCVALKGTNGTTIYLRPESAQAFRTWSNYLNSGGAPILPAGGLIPCTGGWRSCAEADAAAARNPERFAPCRTSWHTAGAAVDVDMGWLGKLSFEQQNKVRLAAKMSGWSQARWGGPASCGGNTSNDNEPWHFSHGGCG